MGLYVCVRAPLADQIAVCYVGIAQPSPVLEEKSIVMALIGDGFRNSEIGRLEVAVRYVKKAVTTLVKITTLQRKRCTGKEEEDTVTNCPVGVGGGKN